MKEPFEKGANAAAHVGNVIAAHRDSDQPGATFRAIEAAMGATIGHKLFTLVVHHPERQVHERIHSSLPAAYPTGGRQPVAAFPLKQHVLVEGEPYIGRTAEDIRASFLDHEVILSLDCESALVVPVRWHGQTLGSVSLLHDAFWYSEADVPLARLFAQLALPAMMLIPRA